MQIILSSEVAMHERVTGPTQLLIQVPPGTATRFVADDPGFGHFGYDVHFVESQQLVAAVRTIGVVLEAYVPADNPPEGSLPLLLELFPLGTGDRVVERAEGLANEWVNLRATLAAHLGEADVTPAGEHTTDGRNKNRNKRDRGKKRSP